jgi:GTP-binding protein
MRIEEVKFIKSVVELEKDFSPLKAAENNKKQVLLLWRSNVGKSSMINSLFANNHLAHASSKAWKTRTINIFEVNRHFECLDFPGYWYARWWKEDRETLRDMILDYLGKSVKTDIKVVMILDSQVGPTPQDMEVYDYIKEHWVNTLIILNKVDKVSQKELDDVKSKVKAMLFKSPFIVYSCKTNRYRDEALKEIFNF